MLSISQLGPLEKQVMEIVWQHQSVTVKDVALALEKKKPLAYTTVLTILTRLWKKGMLTREKVGKSYAYTSKHDKQQTLHSIARQMIDSLVDRYGDDAIAAFIDEVDDVSKKK